MAVVVSKNYLAVAQGDFGWFYTGERMDEEWKWKGVWSECHVAILGWFRDGVEGCGG
jgi:hypothetical protein